MRFLWYHYPLCAEAALDESLVGRARVGGQSASGPVHMYWKQVTAPHTVCTHCGKLVPLGQRAILVHTPDQTDLEGLDVPEADL